MCSKIANGSVSVPWHAEAGSRAKLCNISDVGSDSFLVSFGIAPILVLSADFDVLAVLVLFLSTCFIPKSSTDLVGSSLRDHAGWLNYKPTGAGIDLSCIVGPSNSTQQAPIP